MSLCFRDYQLLGLPHPFLRLPQLLKSALSIPFLLSCLPRGIPVLLNHAFLLEVLSLSGGSPDESGTIADIAGLEPEATMVDGFSTSRSNVASSAGEIRNWLRDINIIE